MRAKACLDGLRQNLTKENQKITGAFYSIIAPAKTKEHGPIGKTFQLFGLKNGYSKTIYQAINRRMEWDDAIKNS